MLRHSFLHSPLVRGCGRDWRLFSWPLSTGLTVAQSQFQSRFPAPGCVQFRAPLVAPFGGRLFKQNCPYPDPSPGFILSSSGRVLVKGYRSCTFLVAGPLGRLGFVGNFRLCEVIWDRATRAGFNDFIKCSKLVCRDLFLDNFRWWL